MRENAELSFKERFYTADPNGFPHCLFGDPVNLEAWVKLDYDITIQEFVEIFKENFVNDEADSNGRHSPLLIKYIVFYYKK